MLAKQAIFDIQHREGNEKHRRNAMKLRNEGFFLNLLKARFASEAELFRKP